jgi:ubiquitin-protein ligase
MSRFIKKLLKDYEDIKTNPIENIKVTCKDNNIYECYCLFHGLSDEYQDGEYILNIKLAPNHPMEPPNFFFLTPNGRFEINKKLCFSNSGYHAESWSPMWNLRTIILGFLSFFLDKQSSGIGHLNKKDDEKKSYAQQSKEYNATNLSEILSLFQ